jgi:hypothetical protein
MELKEMARKMQICVSILCALLIGLVIVSCYWVIVYINDLQAEKKELEKQNKCYQTLYNEDIIDIGCDKYFQNDSWYIEYKKEVADNE